MLISKPIFLVGAERSGTTMLRLMLSHHPQIAWCNEFEYVVDQISRDGQWPPLDQYYEWLQTHRIFRATGFELDMGLTYPQLANSFLVQKRDRTDKPIVGATVHRHFNRLLKIWPDARFIHIIRDGRDVARSNIGMGWAGNVWTGVQRWFEVESLWQTLSHQLTRDRWIEVTYEALISNPEQELTRLCDFIGPTYDPGMLSYSQDSSFEFPDPKYIGQWQRKLSDHQIQLIESKIADLLVARGYELSGLPPIQLSPLAEKQLKLQDWWGRFQFRLNRYGPSLFAQDYLARNLGLKSWEKQLKA
ncbi:MAG: sulfotransferase [Oscillatoriales cyanobacterium RM1_1_9]|nr:sulfotransferase [Oscillatoriales cyanobacterium RM1_1_9]